MKLTKVEHLFDGSRLIFYYTSDTRVDFRELVRDLAAHFRMRIEMRQIGVRDEAKMLGGYGSCGRPLCCTTWLRSFEPVSIKMAKQQQLSLNPSKLSGQCGRLKCCLRYELPNGEGVKHAGCGDHGGCSNPTGCGNCGAEGGCGSCGHHVITVCTGSLRLDVPKPAIGITVGDPAGIGPEIALKAAADPARARGLRAGALRAARRRRSFAAFTPGQLSADAGRAAYEAIVARGRRRAGRDDRRHRDGADQQGSVRARRPAVEGPHRPAGAS